LAILDPTDAIGLIPGYDPHRDAEGYEFKPEEARKVVRWVHNHITHVKGELTATPYVLAPIEQAIVFNLFGWFARDTGLRRYRKCLVYVARKFSKTTLCAALTLYGFFEERGGCSCPLCGPVNYPEGEASCQYAEGGVESYAAAYTRDQAKLLWGPAKKMIRNDEELVGRCRIYQHSIVRYEPGTTDDDGSYFLAISADANSAHGLNPYIYAMDELHTQKSAELLDTLDTGVGSRAQPLGIRITTADFAGDSICNEEHAYATEVRNGTTTDAEYLPVIFEASKEDDPFLEETWRKANPKYPATPKRAYLESQARKAQHNVRFLNTFKRLHLNIITDSDVAWFEMAQWDACEQEYGPEDLAGERCFAGIDLAKTTDLTALALYFPDKHAALLWSWLPRDSLEKRTPGDRDRFLQWAREGRLKLTPGNVCDYDVVKDDCLTVARHFDVEKWGFDPWNASQFANQLQAEGCDILEVRQTYQCMSEPAKELERLVISEEFQHDGNPVLRYCAGNAMVQEDHKGNIYPSKKKSAGHIDGIVALVVALFFAVSDAGPLTSVYETRGFLEL
jgi:phage terminase large subunit-like protein